jgi:hypothetical protein
MIIPISKNIIEPVKTSNIFYVNSLEEFEKIELELNETRLGFDNNQQCFYVRERDKYGEYSPVMIFFYENFAQKISNLEREEFIKKCKDAGLDDLKTECAIRFFLLKHKPYDVWIWVTSEKGKDWSWDYVISLKCKLKKKLFPKVAII